MYIITSEHSKAPEIQCGRNLVVRATARPETCVYSSDVQPVSAITSARMVAWHAALQPAWRNKLRE